MLKKVHLKNIDTEGLPEPVVQAVRSMVQSLREQFGADKRQSKRVQLPHWPGKPIGKVTRQEIYEDD